MFSRCTKEYVHINIYFLNNQTNASVFYTQLTYCTLQFCYYRCVFRVFIYLHVWNCGAWCFAPHPSLLGFSFSLICIITTFVNSIISFSITVVSLNLTSAKPHLHTFSSCERFDALTGKRQKKKFLYTPPVKRRTRITVAVMGVRVGLRFRAIRILTIPSSLIFHKDPCRLIKPQLLLTRHILAH